MDFVSLLKEKIEERQEESFDLLPVLVQNWVVFQRSTFDYLDENDEPFTSQIFLIEVCTGRYVHRTHGVRVDFGVTLDLDILAAKLVEAFVGTKVCHGLPVKHDEVHPSGRLTRQEYPYPRLVSRECVHWYQPNKREGLEDGDVDESRRSVCPACQKAKRVRDDLCAEEETGQELKVETDEISQTLLPKAEADVSEETPSLDWIADDILKDLKGHESEDSDASYPSSSLDRIILDETEESDTAVKRCGRKRCKVAKSNETPVRTHKKNLKCNHCFQVFPSTTVYHRHQREKRQVGCKQCNKKVVTFGDLRKHLAKKHPESYEGPFKSLWENDEDEETMLKPRACFRCDRVFNGAVLLYRHKEFYHELGDYKCSDCQEPCLTFYDLIIHNYRQHSKAIAHVAPYTRGLEVIVDKDGKVEKKRTLFACHLCPETFTMDCTYTHHMRKYHAWGLFECIACDEVGHYAGEVSAHMVNFHRDNPEVKCPNCSSVVSLREDDDEFLHHYESCKHVWSTSGKKKSRNKDFVEKLTFQCHFCGKNYASKFILDAHIKVHQGIEQFKCSYCDYGTNVKSALKEHEQYHMREQGLTNDESGVQLYHYCDQCGQKFTRPSYVRVHKKRVHDGVKLILECKDCSPCETFRSKKMLYKHKREKHGYVPVKRTKVGRRPLD
ncbi:hypothetical protein TCAL_07438 [Tigriopus californicus]|uniref:C2H2-type domain-containing protein n=1 Tax=Tigriopus californicus TaxID=6832 RepID=A0A553N7Q1_TIGCA|nr:zinc finger protein 845-like [Tigriopus californicus]TRY61467.1 hypothetical protein TCAL_07438 [Tigriopus californicus]|eukprot:TCALIF_07438-PA protein Name:"Similar to ZNF699 Zinc finger protein 699 (Homo sapiens)" AED:0.55 eAED:0.55 QI:0/-1/0/1/-1/1/1/0/666